MTDVLRGDPELGEFLWDLRVSSGKTQKEVANVCGVSRGMISRIETGARHLSIPTLVGYCRVFGYDSIEPMIRHMVSDEYTIPISRTRPERFASQSST